MACDFFAVYFRQENGNWCISRVLTSVRCVKFSKTYVCNKESFAEFCVEFFFLSDLAVSLVM